MTAVVLGASLVFGGVAAGLGPDAPVASAQQVPSPTPAVVDVDALNMRDAPGLSGTIVATLRYNTRFRVFDLPAAVDADGYKWYPVQLHDGTMGWAVFGFVTGVYTDEDLAQRAAERAFGTTPTMPTTPAVGTLIYGDPVMVNTDLLNVRSLPSISASILTVYPFGTTGTITGGPTVADGITWYAVDNYGWVASDYIRLNACGCRDGVYPDDGGGSNEGLTVNADVLNVRSAPSLSGTIVGTRYYGQTVPRFGQATAADGSTWIAIDSAQTLWVSAPYVS